jgi:glycine/D-amino acid oxidase-like deaminating enzyme
MSVFKQVGGIDLGHKDDKNIADLINAAKVNNYAIDVIEGADEISKRFPLIKPPKDYVCIFEKNAGLLNAFEAVRMMQWLAVKYGCQIHEHEKMITFETINEHKIKVVTNKGVYITKKLVLCTGAWLNKTVVKSYQNMQLPDLDLDGTIHCFCI